MGMGNSATTSAPPLAMGEPAKDPGARYKMEQLLTSAERRADPPSPTTLVGDGGIAQSLEYDRMYNRSKSEYVDFWKRYSRDPDPRPYNGKDRKAEREFAYEFERRNGLAYMSPKEREEAARLLRNAKKDD